MGAFINAVGGGNQAKIIDVTPQKALTNGNPEIQASRPEQDSTGVQQSAGD